MRLHLLFHVELLLVARIGADSLYHPPIQRSAYRHTQRDHQEQPFLPKSTRLVASDFPTEGVCLGATDIALVDGRRVSGPSQCRVTCTTFDVPGIKVDVFPDDCPFFADDDAKAWLKSDDTFCIPRGVCIRQCGREKPGCVYSGSCTSQVCFSSAATSTPAKLDRITHYGPASYVSVGTIRTNDTNDRPLTPFEYGIEERCTDDSIRVDARRTAEECPSRYPLDDGREENDTFPDGTQCRVPCETFNNQAVEVVQFWTFCEVCSTDRADIYVQALSKKVCLPVDMCVSACGELRPGCVYTGTCRSQFCYSGIDSKKPAIITLGDKEDGNDVDFTVDNSGSPETIDPPAFSGLILSIDSTTLPTASPSRISTESSSSSPSPTAVSPGAPSTPSPSAPSTPSPSARPTPPGQVSSQPGQGQGQATSSDSNGGGVSIWAWLGPLVAAIVGAAGYIIAAVIKRTGRSRTIPGDRPSESTGAFSTET